MKNLALLFVFLFGFRVFGAISISDLEILNDPIRYDQFILEHIDNGVIQ
jgi:hypothetical protein